MKVFTVIATILIGVAIILATLPLLSIYFQWLANNFTPPVLFWTTALGIIGLIILSMVVSDQLEE